MEKDYQVKDVGLEIVITSISNLIWKVNIQNDNGLWYVCRLPDPEDTT